MTDIASIKYNCCSNGEGCRTAVFLYGCPGVIWNKKTKKHDHCPGCFNYKAWAFEQINEIDFDKKLDNIVDSLKFTYVDGLSILGGEPMCRENQETTWHIIKAVRERYSWSKTIWLWTGHIFTRNPFNKNRIPKTKWTKKILKNVNVLVDGPFIKDKFDINLKYRGSSNQRVLQLLEAVNH